MLVCYILCISLDSRGIVHFLVMLVMLVMLVKLASDLGTLNRLASYIRLYSNPDIN